LELNCLNLNEWVGVLEKARKGHHWLTVELIYLRGKYRGEDIDPGFGHIEDVPDEQVIFSNRVYEFIDEELNNNLQGLAYGNLGNQPSKIFMGLKLKVHLKLFLDIFF
jgi:hypothetical protein